MKLFHYLYDPGGRLLHQAMAAAYKQGKPPSGLSRRISCAAGLTTILGTLVSCSAIHLGRAKRWTTTTQAAHNACMVKLKFREQSYLQGLAAVDASVTTDK